MKHLGNILFLILCFGLGIGIAKFYLNWRSSSKDANPPAVLTGVGRLMPFRGFTLDPATPPTPAGLQAILDSHATLLALHYPSSASHETELTRSVQLIRQNPATRDTPLCLLPPNPPLSGIMNPYPLALPEIAQQAQRLGFQYLVVSSLTSNTPDAANWESQLTAARKNFTGKIILAGTFDALTHCDFIPSADFLGLLVPSVTLTDKPDPSVHDLRVGWSSHLNTLESLARHTGKPLFLLDYSTDPANKIAFSSGLQRKHLEAFLLETKGRLNTDGLLLPAWSFAPKPPATSLNAHPELLTLITGIWSTESASPDSSTPTALSPSPIPTFEDENTTEER